MSKTIAIRVSDEIYSALEAKRLATGKHTMTDLLTPIILGAIELPAAPLSPIEQRLLELEERVLAITLLKTQMAVVVDRLDAMDRPTAPEPTRSHSDHTKEQLKTEIAQQALFDIGLKPMEPVAIDSKISPESIRDLNEAGISTHEFTQHVEPLLRAYSKGGYYFRFGDAVELKLKVVIQRQAKQLGFESKPIQLGGKSVRVWLNRDYCKHSANS